MERIQAFLSRKVFGLPMSILLFVGALLFGAVAFFISRQGDGGTAPEGDVESPAGDGVGALGGPSNPVFLAGQGGGGGESLPGDGALPPTTETTELLLPEEQGNDTWLSKSVAYAVANGYDASNATTALRNFLSGIPLSYQQGQIRDLVVGKYGIPPEVPPASDTEVYSGPASKQGTPPLRHKVTGSSDNQPIELALLYYGSNSASNVALIKSGGDTRDLYAVGDYVPVPEAVAGVVAPPAGPLPTPVVNSNVYLGVKANENMASFIKRVKSVHKFDVTAARLKALNPTKPLTIDKMIDGDKHEANELRVK